MRVSVNAVLPEVHVDPPAALGRDSLQVEGDPPTAKQFEIVECPRGMEPVWAIRSPVRRRDQRGGDRTSLL